MSYYALIQNRVVRTHLYGLVRKLLFTISAVMNPNWEKYACHSQTVIVLIWAWKPHSYFVGRYFLRHFLRKIWKLQKYYRTKLIISKPYWKSNIDGYHLVNRRMKTNKRMICIQNDDNYFQFIYVTIKYRNKSIRASYRILKTPNYLALSLGFVRLDQKTN